MSNEAPGKDARFKRFKNRRLKKKEMKEEDYSGSLYRVNGVVERENKQPKSRREKILAEKQGDMCGI